MQFIFISVKGHTTSIDTSFRTNVSFLNNTLQFWNYKLCCKAYIWTGRVNTLVFIATSLCS